MTQVVITRPLEPAQQLAGQLAEHGLSSIIMPLYTFSELAPSAEAAAALARPARPRLAVFTSPRAVNFGLSQLPADRIPDTRIAAIGEATRSALEKRGIDVHLVPARGFTSEDLLQLPELAVAPGLAIIFCAPGGREALAKGLAALGWDVVPAMVYERVALPPAPAHVKAITEAGDLVSIWTSVAALELAREHLPGPAWDKLLRSTMLVISERIQHHLQRRGAGRVVRSDGPGNADLLRAVLRLAEGAGET
ncbi:MAG: uroporphyrinogen-III synthase [Lysobacterales bacterium]|jgi:uroporphyrinogen-III synthase